MGLVGGQANSGADPAHLWERLHLQAPSKGASGWARDGLQGRWEMGRSSRAGLESVVPQGLGPHLAARRCLVSTG